MSRYVTFNAKSMSFFNAKIEHNVNLFISYEHAGDVSCDSEIVSFWQRFAN